jgi:hypothetical protein
MNECFRDQGGLTFLIRSVTASESVSGLKMACGLSGFDVNISVKSERKNVSIDGYGTKSTNSDLAGFYLLLYIRQHAGLFRRRTKKISVLRPGENRHRLTNNQFEISFIGADISL